MSSNLFSGDIWSLSELKELLKKLEGMYAGGVRQSTFKDQTLIFGSTAELKERITSLRDAICQKEVELGISQGKAPSRKKMVRFTTNNRGFGPKGRRGKN